MAQAKMIPSVGKQKGFVVSLEAVLFIVLIVLGSIMGWVAIRDSFNAELFDTANAIESSITFAYFSDPNRGTVVPVVPQTYSFPAPVATEDCGLSIGCPP
jgi:hypothetical protein